MILRNGKTIHYLQYQNNYTKSHKLINNPFYMFMYKGVIPEDKCKQIFTVFNKQNKLYYYFLYFFEAIIYFTPYTELNIDPRIMAKKTLEQFYNDVGNINVNYDLYWKWKNELL